MLEIFFYPLVIIFKYLYVAIATIVGNLGLSLVVLSIVVNLLMRPFMLWASKIQDKERRIQSILSPQINEIKKEFRGAEQHAELSELYRCYAYNPIYAIRSGMNLFVQLLPLSAAYVMLSSLTILKGQSFLCVADLSQSDALLRYEGMCINVLPILMTLINFAATLTTPNFTHKEKAQGFIIGILFLVLLYRAPSALLIYWTTNNIITLLKNVIGDLSLPSFKIKGTKIRNVMLLIPFVLFVTYLVYFGRTFMSTFPATTSQINRILLLTSVFLVFSFVWIFLLNFLQNDVLLSELLARGMFIGGGLLLSLFLAKYMLSHSDQIQGTFRGRYVYLFILVQFLYFIGGGILSVPTKSLQRVTDYFTEGRRTSLFFSAVFTALIFACVYFPTILYASDPEFFPNTLSATIANTGAYGFGVLLIATFMWFLFPSFLQNIIAIFSICIVCIALINSFVLTEYYGKINAMQMNATLLKVGIRSLSRDALSTFLSITLIILCIWKKWIRHIVTVFYLISIALLGISGYHFLTISNEKEPTLIDASLPDYHDRLWRFSKQGKNVVGIFLDGFTGDHVLRILEDEPDIAEKFDGFIYFPDTLSVGAWTNLSTAAIYGGPSYRPNVLNEKFPDKRLAEKYAMAASLYPNVFIEKGYDVVLAGTPMLYEDNPYYSSKLKYPDAALIRFGFNWGKDYVPNWLKWAEENGIRIVREDQKEEISRFAIFLAAFRAAPFSLRSFLYNDGMWRLGITEGVLKVNLENSFLPSIAPIQFLGDFVNADEGKSTFKMIYTHLSHPECYLPEDSLCPVPDPYPETPGQSTLVDGLFPEHYYTEKHVLHFISNFIASLKRLGVYDNTRIVIVSDHDFSDSWKMNASGNPYVGKTAEGNVWPNALLMFKDFDKHMPMCISEALMSNEDTPSLLLDGIAKVDGIPDLETLRKASTTDRVRIHCGMTLHSSDFIDAYTFLLDAGIYEVRGTMFNKNNWFKID